jgi:hypothetical protein
MEKKHNSLTFEDLEKNVIIDNAELTNEDYHNSTDFLENYYHKYNRLPIADKRKESYLSWHKELGNTIYDISTGKFKAAPVKDKLNFLKTHPYLTNKDNKSIVTIRNNLDEKHKRSFIFSYLAGLTFFIVYVRYRVGAGNFRNFIFSNKMRIFMGIVFSVFSYDIFYKLKMRDMYLDSIIENKGFKKRYFDNYLI